LKNLDNERYKVPEDWPYKEARELFLNPEVTPGKDVDIKAEDPDEAGLIQFLVVEKGFNEERVKSGVQKLLKQRAKSTQARVDSFFKVLPKDPEVLKRKAEAAKAKAQKEKKAKTGSASKKAKTK
jgi:flap endonuclease-1